MTYVKHADKFFPGGKTTATILTGKTPALYRVTVITRFDSGNYLKESDMDNLSLVAAEGMLAFHTR
jgi:hypothetical protein